MRINKHKKEKMKRIIAMVCAAFVALAFLASVILPAAMAAPTQKEIDAAKAKTEQAKKDLQAAEERKKAAVNEFNAIDNQISNTEDEIKNVTNLIEQTKTDLEQKQEELKLAEEEYKRYQELFLVRARTMYESGDITYLEILFGSKGFNDFIKKMDVVSQIMEYDHDVLAHLEATWKKIEEAKKSIEEILKRQETNRETLSKRKETLEAVLAEKQELLNSLQKDEEKYKAIVESAERAEAEMIKQNQSSLTYDANPIKYTGGKLNWPVPDSQRVTSYYGYRIHPVYKTKKFHSGIDIGIGYGKAIVAAADGTVTLSAYNGGYGKCLIVNHGSGLSTLYAHNSSLLVSKGEKVTRGQVIAYAGSTGVSTGPHLHFEVRVNGATTDPLSYLR